MTPPGMAVGGRWYGFGSKGAEQAAVDEYLRAVDVTGRLAGEEHAKPGQILRHTKAFHWIHRCHRGLRVGTPGLRHLGVEGARMTKLARTLGAHAPASASVSAFSPAFAIA